MSLTPAQERVCLREGCEDQLSAPSGKYSVEVRWRVWPRLFAIPLDAESLWHRLGSIRVARRTITTLSPEDLLFILCVHGGVNHYWQDIRYACDVAEVIRQHPDLSWSRVREQSERLGCRRVVGVSLLLAERLLDAPLPEEVVHWARADGSAERVAGQVERTLLADEPMVVGPLSGPSTLLRARERLSDRARYLYRLATASTSEEWRLVSLPSSLAPLYGLIRPLRLVAKYVSRLLS